MKNWSWGDTWRSLGIAGVVAVVVFLGVFIMAPKNVDYYYVSTASGSEPVICAYAHWTWHADERAYCSDDKDKVLDFVTKANASLRK